MAIQHSVAVRNARLDTIEATIGASPVLEIRSGAPPADCAAADTGTVLSTINLPPDWMANAAGGIKDKTGTWQDADADAAGVAGHFRLKDSGLTACHQQGTVTATGGGGDLQLDNINIAAGQQITITQYRWTDGNA